RWCQQLQDWAGQAQQVLLLLCHGEVATLAPRLLSLNRSCAGVAQLHPHRGALQLLLHYWSNSHGVVAQRSFGVEQESRGLRHLAEADAAGTGVDATSGSDRDVFLAQTE
ncbi:BcsE family c-di-GMP-binding protein, partial [Mycobacterium tuberculosis]